MAEAEERAVSAAHHSLQWSRWRGDQDKLVEADLHHVAECSGAQLVLAVLVRVEAVEGEHLGRGHVQAPPLRVPGPGPGSLLGAVHLRGGGAVEAVRGEQRHLLLLLVHLEK